MLAAVANGEHGLSLLDVTEPAAARILRTTASERSGAPVVCVDVELAGRYELGDTTGITPTVERDVAYTAINVAGLRAVLIALDVTDPEDVDVLGDASFPREVLIDGMTLARSFNPPQLVTRMLVGGPAGLSVVELTDSSDPVRLFDQLALSPLSDVAVEAFAFDRMLDESGRPLKDISHEGARYMGLDEIARVLAVPVAADDDGRRREDLREAFADRPRPGGTLAGSLPVDTRPNLPDGERRTRLAAGFALLPDDPLARLVRPLHLPDFDDNEDGGLTRGELEDLLFAALDANGDGRLDALEWPAHPHADPAALDRDRDGEVDAREMDLDDEVFGWFDLDGDDVVTAIEWPWAVVPDPMPVLMYTSAEHLREMLDAPGFERDRPELYQLLAGRPEIKVRDIEPGRLEQAVERARANPLQDAEGLDALGGFLLRWDLDGDGAVEAEEWSPFAQAAARLDLDGDGEIDEDDVRRARRE